MNSWSERGAFLLKVCATPLAALNKREEYVYMSFKLPVVAQEPKTKPTRT